jgi:hypothetical protein
MKKLMLLSIALVLSAGALQAVDAGKPITFSNRSGKDIFFKAINVDNNSMDSGTIANKSEEVFYVKTAKNPVVITLTNPKDTTTGSKFTINAGGKITIKGFSKTGFVGKTETDPKKMDITVQDIKR